MSLSPVATRIYGLFGGVADKDGRSSDGKVRRQGLAEPVLSRLRMSQLRRRLRLGAAASLLGLISAAGPRAEDIALLPSPLGLTALYASDGRSGLGLAGYDPLSLWLDAQPRPGDPALELAWGGFAWRFVGEANRAAFRRDPEAFLPRFGGYDAVGIAQGRIARADPTIILVREDRLYLFRTMDARALFVAHPDLAEAAEARWPALQAGLARD